MDSNHKNDNQAEKEDILRDEEEERNPLYNYIFQEDENKAQKNIPNSFEDSSKISTKLTNNSKDVNEKNEEKLIIKPSHESNPESKNEMYLPPIFQNKNNLSPENNNSFIGKKTKRKNEDDKLDTNELNFESNLSNINDDYRYIEEENINFITDKGDDEKILLYYQDQYLPSKYDKFYEY